MFLQSSRYYQQSQVETTDRNGRTVKALSLRILPSVEGKPLTIKEHDRLDLIAQRQYNDATKFWHIADANSELQAAELLRKTQRLLVIEVPDQ